MRGHHPYAKAVDGEIDWDEALFSYPLLVDSRRRNAVPGGWLRVQARAMLVLRCRY